MRATMQGISGIVQERGGKDSNQATESRKQGYIFKVFWGQNWYYGGWLTIGYAYKKERVEVSRGFQLT